MISKEQIEELAKWCGFEYKECNPNHPQMKDSPYGMGWFNKVDKGLGFHNLPDFRQDLNACFRYIVPKAIQMIRVNEAIALRDAEERFFRKWLFMRDSYSQSNWSEALCLAVLKLIKAGI